MRLRPKWLLAVGLALLFAASGVLLVYLRQGEDYAEEIRAGKLGCTSRLGWVNWNHARPEGVRRFLDEVQARWREAAGRSFAVSYAQRMSCRWGWLGMESRLSRTYQVSGGLSSDELDRVTLGIFREVSEAFEEMQGRFPNALDARSQSSSFREGDLTGDSVAFYCALHHRSLAALKKEVGALPVPASLRELQRKNLRPSRSWELPVGTSLGPSNPLWYDRAWFSKHSHLLEHTETHFRFYFIQ